MKKEILEAAQLPTVTSADFIALGEYVADNHATKKGDCYVLTAKQSREAMTALLVRSVTRPRIAKALAMMLANGETLSSLAHRVKDDVRVFPSDKALAVYAAGKEESASSILTEDKHLAGLLTDKEIETAKADKEKAQVA